MSPSGEGESNVVSLRVQVIDVRSFTLDLQVPTYLPARDLTQRVARDAGLEAHWDDGRRRLYWMRARGRLMGENERLSDLGVIDGELVYLLPEPPAGSDVVEQVPEYPITHDYAGAGYLALLGSTAIAVLWAALWSFALQVDRSLWVVCLPGLALGFICVSLARHMWGGRGTQVRIVISGLVVHLVLGAMAVLGTGLIGRVDLLVVYQDSAPGLLLGLAGVVFGWFAWWGAVEPLPTTKISAAPKAMVTALVPCGICAQPVEASVRMECRFRCGQNFHQGCYKARAAVYRGGAAKCEVCTRAV